MVRRRRAVIGSAHRRDWSRHEVLGVVMSVRVAETRSTGGEALDSEITERLAESGGTGGVMLRSGSTERLA